MNNNSYKTQVVIAGAGPVGLTLAIDLAQRGIEVVIVETRYRGEPPSVKCNHVSSRTMEIMRRLGVSKALRKAGLPDDYPNDVAYRTTFTGEELSRITIPGRAGRASKLEGPDTWWPTPEPPHRINQIYLEPVIFEFAARTPGVTILNRTSVDSFEQTSTGVRVFASSLEDGSAIELGCDYLIGCDGGRSTVRKAIGAKLSGTDVVGRVQSTFVRAPDLLSRIESKPAWATFSINPRRSGNVYAIDGKELWLIHNYLAEGETTFDAVDRDWAIREILGVADDFHYEVISKEDWIGRRLVADKFRDRRVFICGDAAHLWIPMAGYGMNAGIADAMNLSWHLASYLNGWADESVLDAYEAERLPITEQVSNFAMNHALALQRECKAVPGNVEDDSEAGRAARLSIGRNLYELNVKQYCCGGLNYGYFYDHSPLISYDGERPPAYTIDSFTQSTVPGCRTPHLWLDDGASLYDVMGSEYTLLRFDPGTEVLPLVSAAEKAGLPLVVVDVECAQSSGVYDRKLVLSRPDFHVAWRGDDVPADCNELVNLLQGRAVK
ncbi:FAD-dependent oxidoreductase [Pseudomonas syringae]|uniref:FAD-dependent oxidoreductase n=1 Tax=Pseudomonas syringae TaxID=317 RepID=UPI001F257939|nr:FAD-dependent oxidoreductase [Pseudomonas syringae]MCF5724126.1 monooxygenase [Pseudomonas syringae]